MPARKKDASARARANRASTSARLSDDNLVPAGRRPKLPPRGLSEEGKRLSWHPQTLKWWADIWGSPMAGQWHPTDAHSLFMMALLVDRLWTASASASPQQLSQLAGEIRQQRTSFGLTPYDRRRLEWSIEAAEEAKDRGTRRRTSAPAPPKAGSAAAKKAAASDPRRALHAV